MSDLGTSSLEQALVQCRDMISIGSKSFSLASRLFGKESQAAAFFLYGWCRFCDDQIDQAKNQDEADRNLKDLRKSTELCFGSEPLSHPVFIAFQHVTRRYQIPQVYPLELLEGMAMDVQGYRYETLKDLKLYCYRVASTVGLMMVHIMRVSDERALKNASDLGMAMQMTNIARDVFEDYSLGRIYLPREWLREVSLSEEQFAAPENREKVAQLVRRLLDEADPYYASGREGLVYLPLRAALAVAAAGSVYSQIGETVRARGSRAWESRTIVPQWKKWIALARGVFTALSSLPQRMIQPWREVPIRTIWRHL